MKNLLYFLFALSISAQGQTKVNPIQINFPTVTAPTISSNSVTYTSFNLTWNDVGAFVYYIYESTSTTKPASPSYVVVETMIAPVLSQAITGKTASTTYHYWIDAYKLGIIDKGSSARGDITTLTNTNVQIVYLGTSLTYGAQGVVNPVTVNPATQSWPAQLQTSLGAGYEWTNFGVSGYTVQQIHDIEVPQAVSAFDATAVYNIAYLEGGTNDFTQGRSAATTYSTIKTSALALEAAGYKVIIVTSPAYNATAVSGGVADNIAAEDVRQQLLDLERSQFISDLAAKGLCEWGSNTIFGIFVGAGNSNYTYYQQDDTHMTPTGYGAMATIGQPAVSPIVAGGTYNTQTSAATVTLTALTTSAGSISPTFSSSTLEYTATTTSSTCTITPTTGGATITVNGLAVTSGSASASLPLIIGVNKFLVQTLNSKSRKTYQLSITRTFNPALNANINFQVATAITSSSNVWNGTNAAGSYANGYGIDTVTARTVAAGHEAFLFLKYTATNASDNIFGFRSNKTSEPYTNNNYRAAFLYTIGGGNNFKAIEGSIITTIPGVTLTVGNYYGIHVLANGSMYFCTSPDALNWTDFYHFTYVNVGNLTPLINTYGNASFTYLPIININ